MKMSKPSKQLPCQIILQTSTGSVTTVTKYLTSYVVAYFCCHINKRNVNVCLADEADEILLHSDCSQPDPLTPFTFWVVKQKCFRLLAPTLTLHGYHMVPGIKLSVCAIFTITNVRHSLIYSHADKVRTQTPRLSARRLAPGQNTASTKLE